MAPPLKPKVGKGDRVLCFHGPLLYEAKCVKWQVEDKQMQYFIHYNGWNKNWDEWVPENRVLKYNEANLQKQKELQSSQQKNKRSSKAITKKPPGLEKEEEKKTRSSTPSLEKQQRKIASDGSDQPKRKRLRLDPTLDSEESILCQVDTKLPEELKPLLVDDWDYVTRQKQLLQLPSRLTVEMILDDYVKYKMSKGQLGVQRESALLEVSAGIREYFNIMLGSQLLYKFERPQYAEMLADHSDKPMAKIYGAHHLLRLFVKLGNMVSHTVVDDKSSQLLMGHISEFLRYLQKNKDTLFLSTEYVEAPPEYHRRAL